MFVPFIIFAVATFVVGPLHVEGGSEAIGNKGAKAAAEAAWDERDTISLTGNYGNK